MNGIKCIADISNPGFRDEGIMEFIKVPLSVVRDYKRESIFMGFIL